MLTAPATCPAAKVLSNHLTPKPIWTRETVPLTPIQPGEVKVDLANFDVKFQTKFFYVKFFFNDPAPETSC
jgi:hypothetical protein